MRLTKIPAWWCAVLLAAVFMLPITPAAAQSVIISEFLAANSGGLRDEDGDSSDWVELYNAGNTPVNMAGWSLTDDATDLAKWTFPAVELPANHFLVVFASGKDRRVSGAPLHANFSLSAAGEYLALVRPDSVTIATEFAPAYSEQYDNVSFGMGQSVIANRYLRSNSIVRVLIPTNNSLGLSWTATSFADTTWLRGTNGVGYEASVPGFAARLFKASSAVTTIAQAETVISDPASRLYVHAENTPVINYFNTGSPGFYPNDRTFPGLTMGADVEDFVLEATATITFPAPGLYSFGVNSDDGFRLTIGGFVNACDCLRGPSETVATFNIPAAGDYPLRLVFFERGGGSEVELYAAAGAVAAWNPSAFKLVGDTASGGLAVRSTSVGGGVNTTLRSLITTDIQQSMTGLASGAYIRLPFSLANTNQTSLTLEMQYDDGFVAYLNGTEVARRNAPDTLQFDSSATASRTNSAPLVVEAISLSAYRHLLRVGLNQLAIHGLNDSASGSDFLIKAELVEYRATATTNLYFSAPTPGTFNTAASVAYVAAPRFQPERGFYDTNFSLAITSATPGALIYYTTDGTVPGPGSGQVYSGPIPINRTTTVRAAAYKSGHQPTAVDTHTYLFVNDVVQQSTNGTAPGPGWPAPATAGGQVIDYGMDSRIVNDPTWGTTIRNDLKSLPTFSLVTTLSNLFDNATGIYMQPQGAGTEWERPVSLELIYPDGTQGFQINCGARIRGGFSRSLDNPKHALRFAFRDQYGAGSLKYPLFRSQDGASDFDGFDLRTFQNYSWSFQGDPAGHFMRDVFSRDTQIAMGQHAERGDYYHLYINGHYWGIYNTCERPEASYAATYFGGNPDDYDVVKVDPQLGYTIEATDGNLDAWYQLWSAATNGFASDAAYFGIQALNPDGTLNPALTNLLDVPNLIDYMLIILWGGNLDAPISAFLGNQSPNNWYGSRSRNNTGGFRFFVHDSEHTLLDVNSDRTGPFPAGDPVSGGGFPKSNPQYLWQQLSANAEFRMLVADRVQMHLFNDGALSLPAVRERFLSRSNELYRAVVCESARWGDSKRPTSPLTRNHWLSAVAGAWNNFIPNRNAVLLNQLRAQGLFPALHAASFSTNGGTVPLGYLLQLTNPNPAGTIYYTIDGTDPRQRGGAIRATARGYLTPITIDRFLQVRARVFDGGNWSALVEENFYPAQDFSTLAVTEVMYHPPDVGSVSGDELEFIELKNVGNTPLDLSGATFSGITFTFTNGTRLSPGQFIVLGRNPVQLRAMYPGLTVHGVYSGRLDNSGEALSLRHPLGAVIFSFTYNDRAPWPLASDGFGFSLVPRLPGADGDLNDPLYWRASAVAGGSPGTDDPAPLAFAAVLINEVLTHSVLPAVDQIELHNTSSNAVDISGWFLSDDAGNPRKFRFPNGTVIPPQGYVWVSETNFNPTPGSLGSFSLSSTGEEIYLTSADSSGNLTGYSHGLSFGAAAAGISFGRYVNSVGEELFPAQLATTFGDANAGPRVGPVVITEIQYNPAPGYDEFVELVNLSSEPIPLFDPAAPTNTWRLDGLGFTFPPNVTLSPNGLLLLVATNPAVFRARHNVPAEVQILGPFNGSLQNSGERLQLVRPEAPTTNGVPYVVIDEVRYNDKLPWPVSADGAGPSLQRLLAGAYGNDPTNWFASGITAGRSNIWNAPPSVALTSPAAGSYFGPGTVVSLTAQAADADGVLGKVEFYANGTKIGEKTSPPYAVSWSNASPASYTLTARGYDDSFAVTISDPVPVHILAPVQVTLVSTGAIWKYLDNGSNPGATWTQLLFNDAAWNQGPAELGYGDAGEGRGEATVIGYGPNAGAKYITTYFRRSFMIQDVSAVQALSLGVMRDDGFVAYINGVEVFRNNMPAGAVNASTLASTAIGGLDEATFQLSSVAPALLIEGTNVLAVEMHQSSGGSSDLSFDASLTASRVVIPPTITTQPQDQVVSPGTNVTFTAAASGSAPLLYQWQWKGTNLPGATNLLLLLTNITSAQAGAYTLVVRNAAGTAISRTATLAVEEWDTDADGMPDWWERLFGLDTRSSADASLDSDGDGLTNLSEYRVGTKPNDATSVLKLEWRSMAPARFQFVAQPNVSYLVSYKSNTLLMQWRTLTSIAPRSVSTTVEVTDPHPATHSKYYRLLVNP